MIVILIYYVTVKPLSDTMICNLISLILSCQILQPSLSLGHLIGGSWVMLWLFYQVDLLSFRDKLIACHVEVGWLFADSISEVWAPLARSAYDL